MTSWLNRSVGTAPRNGTTSHTISFTAASSGSLLVALVAGSVTNTTPTGWVKQLGPINGTELSVFTKTAAAAEASFSTTHNASNYPVNYAVYEFPSGSTWAGGTSSANSTGWPTLAGLTGTNTVFGAISEGETSGDGAFSGTPTAPWIEDVDQAVVFSTTDGDWQYILFRDAYSSASATPANTDTSARNDERVVFAINVVAVAAATFIPPSSTRRRTPPTRRPRSRPSPVPAQVAATPPPAKVPDLARRQAHAGFRRSRTAAVPLAQPQPPAVLQRRRLGVWRRRPSAPTPVPAQVVPAPPAFPAAALRPRRVLVSRRRPAVAPTVPDQPFAPPQPRPRRALLPRRRPMGVATVPDQAPALAPPRRRRLALVRRTPLAPAPVPAQVAAPAAPVSPGWWLRSRRVLQVRRHSAAPSPVPAQVTPPAPPALPLWTQRPHRVATGLRRGRAVTPVPAQAAAPSAPPLVQQLRTARRVLLPARRRTTPVPIPAQDRAPQPAPRRRLWPAVRHRPVAAPVPAQVVAPAYPRQPLRRRIVAVLLRRPGRLRFPEQPGTAAVGAVDGTARPGDGRPAQSAGPGAGTASTTATGGDGSTIHSGG